MSSNNTWYSTRLRFVVMVEPKGASILFDNIYVFRASDDSHEAFLKAIDIGKLAQEEYLNGEGKRVLWRLKEVMSLDIIRADDLDGAEVYSESIELKDEEIIPFETQFDPYTSKPGQTI